MSHHILSRRRRAPRRALLALAILAAGCGHRSGTGRIEVTYREGDPERSKDPRAFSGAASAAWCPGARRLEVTATNEDMGFGLVVYPVDSLVTGSYSAFDPGIDSARRPGAAAVARWFTEQRVLGLQSDSGALQLTRDGDRVSVRFGFRLRAIDGSDTARATGRADGLVPGACPADSLPGTAPTQ